MISEIDLGGEKSFIGGWIVPEIDVCDELIAYFKNSPSRVVGQIGTGQVNTEVKDSIDLQLGFDEFADPPVRRYIANLTEVVQQYVKKYEGAAAVDGWGITEKMAIQYYKPGGGYKMWHCERTGKDLPGAARHLVFMTYLNDVADAGGTEFLYQGVTTKARKGLTLIWPADWTHHHRGVVSPTEDKYIITGWFDFM